MTTWTQSESVVPRVAEPPLAGFWRIACEIRAGQIIQQDLEIGLEQRLPALPQEAEQLLLVRHQLVQTPVQVVLAGHGEILAQQVADGALRVPLPMQPPLAAWVDQPVGHQRLQHVQPTRSLSRGRQSWRPEVIQPQLIPQMAGQPAGAPLPRPVQPQSAEPDMHHIAIQNWRRAVFGEQRDLPRVLASLVERFDRSAPRGFLAVIDLAQIQHLPLPRPRPPPRPPAVLDDAPVAVLLAALPATLVAQKHPARFCSRRSSRKL